MFENIVWFLVNTGHEASNYEVFRLFERQEPLPVSGEFLTVCVVLAWKLQNSLDLG